MFLNTRSVRVLAALGLVHDLSRMRNMSFTEVRELAKWASQQRMNCGTRIQTPIYIILSR